MLNREPLRPVAAEEIDAFEREGYVVLRDILSPRSLDMLDGACQRLLAMPETLDITDEAVRLAAATAPATPDTLFGAPSYATILAQRGHFFVNFNTAWREPAVLEFALDGAIGCVAAALLRASSVRFVDDILFVKESHTAEPTEWHDDAGSVMSGGKRCSLWVSLGDVPEETGPLQFLPRSHRRFAGWRQQGLDAEVLVREHMTDVVSCPVRRGDLVAHHPELIHGAGPNKSAVARRAWAIRFADEDARFVLPASRRNDREWYALEDGQPLGGPRFPLAWSAVDSASAAQERPT